MNPIPFKYLETYEVTSLDKLLSMIPVTDEVTKEHEERMYEQDMLIMQYGAYAPVDPSLIFDDEEDTDVPFWDLEPEPREGGNEFCLENIPF